MQTKLLPYIIIGILVVAGVAGAGWYFVTRQPVPPAGPVEEVPPPIVQPPPEAPPKEVPVDETANWKTYRNEENGYQVKYPPKYSIEILEYKDRPCFKHPDVFSPDNGCAFVLTFFYLNNKTLEEWLEGTFGPGLKFLKEIGGKTEWMKVGERDWLIVWNPEGPGEGTWHYFTIDENLVMDIQSIRGDLREKPGLSFIEILSTFKILE